MVAESAPEEVVRDLVALHASHGREGDPVADVPNGPHARHRHAPTVLVHLHEATTAISMCALASKAVQQSAPKTAAAHLDSAFVIQLNANLV